MKKILFYSILFIGFNIAACLAQEGFGGSTEYRMEAFGSIAKKQNAPFWMVSNKYGIAPLEAANGYMRIGAFHQQKLGEHVRWGAGADAVFTTPRYKNAYVQQLYMEIGYSCLNLVIGSKEQHVSLWDKNLGSGDLVRSANARPIPEIDLAVPRFTVIPYTKGLLQAKGNFAVGRSMDNAYLEHFAKASQTIVKDVLWHHKSLYLRFSDAYGDFPFSFVAGLRHYAQWAGISSNPKVGGQPRSFKDFLRIVAGKSGGGDATLSDRINVLGNHFGSYDLKIGYSAPSFSIAAYKQHYFEDNSGMEFYNLEDGLYGIHLNFNCFRSITKFVIEYLNTRNQSGPFHHILYDHDEYPGYGGGGDDYYNNGEYTSGASYFNRAIGSPLITSPEYNNDGKMVFKNNRIRAWHIGLEGYLSQQMSYLILATTSENWGRASAPFLKMKDSISCAFKLTYRHPKFDDWQFTGEAAADYGSMYGNNIGFGLTVTKSGILRWW